MVRKKVLILGVFFISLMLTQAIQVSAHTPGPMTLDYDFSTQVLTVQVTHSVTDVNSHYIIQVVIEKNSVEVLTRDYTSQNTTAGFSATYNIAAVDGDVLSVTAICSISGQVTDDITVSDPSATTTTTQTNGGVTPIDMTLIIAVAIVALGAVLVILTILKRR